MQRRKFIVSAAAATITTAAFAGTVTENLVQPSETFYNHYLLFWLKKDLTKQQVDDFANFFKELNTLPYLKSLHYGRAAKSSPRAVLDNSFTYNVVITFDSLEDLEAYGKLPKHLEIVKKYSVFWDKMQVHDSVYCKISK